MKYKPSDWDESQTVAVIPNRRETTESTTVGSCDEIILEYRRMEAETLSAWQQKSDTGTSVGLPDGYFKIGIALGTKFFPAGPLALFLDELEFISRKDPSIVLIPRPCSHFTFLALAGHHWSKVGELPSETTVLSKIVERQMSGLQWQLSDLRIVPGRNFLLLAGLPDVEAQKRRLNLAEELKPSVWKKHVEERYEYKGFPFPPKIWHTTLCRYKRELLSAEMRDLYLKYQDVSFGSVNLGTPGLHAVNYDWTFSQALTQ